jgi:hypothetical protein
MMAKIKNRQGAALADPRFGLSFSNPGASESVLLRNALLQLRFYAILEACGTDGIPFVRGQIEQLRQSGDINEEHVTTLNRMLKSVERGFLEGAAEKAAKAKVQEKSDMFPDDSAHVTNTFGVLDDNAG